MQRRIALSLLFLLLTGCQSIQAPTDGNRIAGLYFARLPCPQCDTVRVNILLDKDYSYDKTEEYLYSNDIFFEQGKWTYAEGEVTLKPTQGKVKANREASLSTIRRFRYENGNLRLLKPNGSPYPGKAKDYLFKKK